MTSSPAPARPNTNTPYYVIIGCGFSGILNHVLLRRTSNPRLGGLDILHIGEQDPWRNYYPMHMGQWPTLLTLPGFTNKPPNLNRYTNLESNEFADVNESEWDQLAKDYPFYPVAGRVTEIRASTIRPFGYEVVLDGGDTFQADYIDVCGGPGPARPIPPPPSMWVDPTLKDEFKGRTVGPNGWPRLVSGEVFLTAKAKPVPNGQHVCVYGGGATGAWCVERAQELGHMVHWVADKELNDAFVASRRNDHLLQRPVVRKIVGDVQVVTSRLRPASPITVFGENMVANQITPTAAGDVEISFSPAASGTWRLTDRTGPLPLGAPTVLALQPQQVVLSIGQETSYTEPGSWAHLLSPVLDGPTRKKNRLIKDRQRRVVGLRSEYGHIRVLGAAALSHPEVSEKWKKPGSPSNVFFRSLVEQARVSNGITLSAISVAEANGFWSSAPNDNLNTCGLKDLKQLTKIWPLIGHFAEAWMGMRGHRIPPFDLDEFYYLAANGKVSY